ncbi:PAAR domain-containing protein [Chelatococcus sp. GCM10030263]|uniref:PAAR domain-containing protein n=1 Tax=Chelatococcus sp. GCM10030263 TaxID=3273387 RepID=UPI00361A7ADB
MPAPCSHPGLPLALIKGEPRVLIGSLPAVRIGDVSLPCQLPGCLPGGPGVVTGGSRTVLIGGLPAARVGDATTHPACVAPIPAPSGRILPPGSTTVVIGG